MVRLLRWRYEQLDKLGLYTDKANTHKPKNVLKDKEATPATPKVMYGPLNKPHFVPEFSTYDTANKAKRWTTKPEWIPALSTYFDALQQNGATITMLEWLLDVYCVCDFAITDKPMPHDFSVSEATQLAGKVFKESL